MKRDGFISVNIGQGKFLLIKKTVRDNIFYFFGDKKKWKKSIYCHAWPYILFSFCPEMLNLDLQCNAEETWEFQQSRKTKRVWCRKSIMIRSEMTDLEPIIDVVGLWHCEWAQVTSPRHNYHRLFELLNIYPTKVGYKKLWKSYHHTLFQYFKIRKQRNSPNKRYVKII